MADTPVSPEEQALRRRARRRLVGAIALALLAVVVLPMVFDSEPKPLGGNVEIVIPEPATPFEAAPLEPAPTPAVTPAEAPPAAQEAKPAIAEALPPAAKESVPPPSPMRAAKPAPPAAAVAVKPAPKPAEKKTPPPAAAKASGYFLQLGAFSQENNARQHADKAQAAGFKASVVSSAGQSKVRVGPFGTREQALAVQTRLKAKGLDSVLIGP